MTLWELAQLSALGALVFGVGVWTGYKIGETKLEVDLNNCIHLDSGRIAHLIARHLERPDDGGESWQDRHDDLYGED